MDRWQIFFVFASIWGISHISGQEPTPSGVRFIGVGYNLVDGNPEGGDARNGAIDPGLLTTRRILALTYNEERITNGFLVPDQVSFSPRQGCVEQRLKTTFYSTKSYQDSLMLGVDASEYKNVQNAVEKEQEVFHEEIEVCNFGRARYREGLATQFVLTEEFGSDACALPTVYNESLYMNFLDSWGTHVVVEADVGHKIIHRSEATRSEFFQYAMRNIPNSVNISGGTSGVWASLKIDIDSFNAQMGSGTSFGNSSHTFRLGSEDNHEPVHIKVIPIVDVFKPKYWTSFSSFIEEGICNSSVSVDKMRENIYKALKDYGEWKNLVGSSDFTLSVPVTWPKGTYGLPKPIIGCPEETWRTGFRKHKSYEEQPEIASNHLDMVTYEYVSPYYHTTQTFCMKTVSEETLDSWEFQEGQYCIYRKGNECPTGFAEGSIDWGEHGSFPINEGVGGSVPDGVYESKTVIYFCCRNDGFYENPILLPTEKPLMLFAKGFECQEVEGMTAMKEYVVFKTFHDITINGQVPIRGPDHLTLYYCYYENNEVS